MCKASFIQCFEQYESISNILYDLKVKKYKKFKIKLFLICVLMNYKFESSVLQASLLLLLTISLSLKE